MNIEDLNSQQQKIINEEILSISFLLILFNFLPWNLLCGCFYITRTRFSNTNQSGRTSTQATPATMMLETTMTRKKLNFIITDKFPSHRDFSKVHFWPSCSLPRLLTVPITSRLMIFLWHETYQGTPKRARQLTRFIRSLRFEHFWRLKTEKLSKGE